MLSEFPGSPRILKGGLVAYRLPDLSPTVIVFQYNPDEVSRSLQMPSATGSAGRGEANRLNGPPQERPLRMCCARCLERAICMAIERKMRADRR